MRPKKQILLLDQNEDRLAMRRYLLWSRAYKVHGASEEARAIRMLEANPCELAIICLPCCAPAALLATIEKTSPFTKTLILAETMDSISASNGLRPNSLLTSTSPISAELLLESVAILCARKRGPKKGTPRPVPATQEACA